MSDVALSPPVPAQRVRRGHWLGVLRSASGIGRTRVGLAIVVAMVLVALLGPLVAPHSPTEFVGIPNSGPSDAAASHSTVRPPYRKRLRTSRPRASAPKVASPDGRLFGGATNSVGEYGATSGPASATSTSRATMTAPIRVRQRRIASATRAKRPRDAARSTGGACPSARSIALSTVWSVTAPPSSASA